MNRVADAVIAGVFLVFTLPLIIIVALAVRMDSPGPVIEGEACIGRPARRFRLLQFRTTVYAPDKPISPRPELTRVGALLRYTRIESLPQLVNVLIGDMSIMDADGRSPSFLE